VGEKSHSFSGKKKGGGKLPNKDGLRAPKKDRGRSCRASGKLIRFGQKEGLLHAKKEGMPRATLKRRGKDE